MTKWPWQKLTKLDILYNTEYLIQWTSYFAYADKLGRLSIAWSSRVDKTWVTVCDGHTWLVAVSSIVSDLKQENFFVPYTVSVWDPVGSS